MFSGSKDVKLWDRVLGGIPGEGSLKLDLNKEGCCLVDFISLCGHIPSSLNSKTIHFNMSRNHPEFKSLWHHDIGLVYPWICNWSKHPSMCLAVNKLQIDPYTVVTHTVWWWALFLLRSDALFWVCCCRCYDFLVKKKTLHSWMQLS